MASRRNVVRMVLSLALAAVLCAPGAPIAATESGSGNGPSEQQLEQLVSPIALYPDTLVGMILAASQYPSQVVEAARYLKDNPSLKGNALTQAVNQQPWDPSIKALTQFPSVLDNMNKNLSWTSALGDAYYNDPQGVMKEIQHLRKLAQQKGSLKTTPQQTVTQNGDTIIIQPSNPQVIYVPQYNPTVVYGAPVATYPGYSSADMMMAGLVGFGAGMLVGTAISGGWGCDWGGSAVVYNNHTYVNNNNNYYNHNWNSNNWNSNHPYNGYNNWTNQLKNQNWQQAKQDFNQDYPNAKRNFDQNHPNWAANHPQSSTNHGDYGRQGGYGDRGNYGGDRGDSGYRGWGSGGDFSGRQGAFGSDSSGRQAFANSGRGRWSGGGWGGGGGHGGWGGGGRGFRR